MAVSLRSLNGRIIVRRAEEQERARGGLYIPETAEEKPQEGGALAAGGGKSLDDGQRVFKNQNWTKSG